MPDKQFILNMLGKKSWDFITNDPDFLLRGTGLPKVRSDDNILACFVSKDGQKLVRQPRLMASRIPKIRFPRPVDAGFLQDVGPVAQDLFVDTYLLESYWTRQGIDAQELISMSRELFGCLKVSKDPFIYKIITLFYKEV